MNDGTFRYAEPLPAQDLGSCWFYHAMNIPGTGAVRGQWDIRGKFKEYIGGLDVCGRTFLDVRTASGFLLFEAKKHGASVTGFDAESGAQYQAIPGRGAPDYSDGYRRMQNGFWLAYKAFELKSQGD